MASRLLVQSIPTLVPAGSSTVFTKALGSWMTCSSGRQYLDFTSGIGVVNTGHCHPRVVAAAQDQCAKLIHGQVNVGFHDKYVELAQTLEDRVHSKYNQFFFSNSGAEAVENAIRIARIATKRSNIIAFKGGFHGRTFGALGLTTASATYREGSSPFVPNVHFSTFPYELHGTSVSQALEDLDELFRQQVNPSDVAAMIIEPVLGEGGYVPCPEEFLRNLRTVCDRHGILLILDEVQTGFGRTGKYFASMDETTTEFPGHILVLAKGLASGFPLSAIAFDETISAHIKPGMIGGTYGGNAVACAAAIATQQVIVEEKLVENSIKQGSRLVHHLREIATRFPEIWDIRGSGSMVGLELTKDTAPGTKKKIMDACFEHELLLFGASIFETVRFIPPLTISADEVDEGARRFEKALTLALR